MKTGMSSKDKLREFLQKNLDNAKNTKDKAYWMKKLEEFNKNFI